MCVHIHRRAFNQPMAITPKMSLLILEYLFNKISFWKGSNPNQQLSSEHFMNLSFIPKLASLLTRELKVYGWVNFLEKTPFENDIFRLCDMLMNDKNLILFVLFFRMASSHLKNL